MNFVYDYILNNNFLMNKAKNKDRQYLTRVDKIENHINKLTLKFFNEDFEHEWRLHEIAQRHNLLYVVCCYFLYVDVLFGMILADTSVASNVIKGVFSLTCIFSIYQIIYHKKAKRLRSIIVSQRQSTGIDTHKWNVANQQKKIQ